MGSLITALLNCWDNLTCQHRWVRARWDDGSYGLRCQDCMRVYPRTLDQLIKQPVPKIQLVPTGPGLKSADVLQPVLSALDRHAVASNT